MKSIRILASVAFLCLTPLAFAQEAGSGVVSEAGTAGSLTPITRSDVLLSTSLSVGINLIGTAECFWASDPYFPYLFLGTMSAQQLPGLFFGGAGAGTRNGIQVGLDGLYCLNAWAGSDLLNPVLFNAAHKFSLYGTYATYVDLRSRTVDPEYNGITRYSFLDLAKAPFEGASYANWAALGCLGTYLAMYGIKLATADQSEAIWTTGTSFIGGTEFPLAMGVGLILLLQVPNFIMTGIGEEAYFRGTVYEEMQGQIGIWPARIIDELYFTAVHYPQQWESLVSMDPLSLLAKTALSMFGAFWFEYMYDNFGLKSAVAVHSAIDVLSFFSDWLIQGGVANDAGFSINSRELSIAFTFRL